MKKSLLLVLMALLSITAAEAKRRETPEEIERKTRHYEGWEYGASARFGLIFYELDYMRVASQPSVSAYKSQAKFGGNIMLNGGYFLNNHWKIGAELGVQMQYNYKAIVPVYVTAHYYYGERKNCFFNFVNLGTNMLFSSVPKDSAMSLAYQGRSTSVRFGATGAGGIGVRLQSPDSSTKYDITLGYQALMLSPRPIINAPYGYEPKDVKRLELNQQVFLGFGVTF